MEHNEYSKPENEHVRDEFITEFQYPDDEFYKDNNVLDYFYENIRIALFKLDKFSQQIVLIRALNPELSLREIANAVGISHELVRQRWQLIREQYPMLMEVLQNRRTKKYCLNTNHTGKRTTKKNLKPKLKKEINKLIDQFEFNF